MEIFTASRYIVSVRVPFHSSKNSTTSSKNDSVTPVRKEEMYVFSYRIESYVMFAACVSMVQSGKPTFWAKYRFPLSLAIYPVSSI